MPPSDNLWYKDAIIYEVHVRAFSDSDGDGYGDFGGLTDKLDYLQDLGITTVWLSPVSAPGSRPGPRRRRTRCAAGRRAREAQPMRSGRSGG